MTAVVVIGGANVDVVAMTAGPPQPHLSTPGRVRVGPGGAGRNVAENLARLGLAPRLIAAVDAGPMGDWLLAETAGAGVDVSGVERTVRRGNYYVALETGGAVEWAVSDMGAAESLTPGTVEAQAGTIRAAGAIVIDANLHPATIRRAVELGAGRQICLLPVSVAKARRMAGVVNRAALIVLTAAEAGALTGRPVRTEPEAVEAARQLREKGGAEVVVTMDDRGIGWIADAVHWRPAPKAEVVDPTGAGDAVAAAAVYALLAGLRPAEAVRLAQAAGVMTLGVEGATHPHLTLEALHAHADLA